MTEALEALEAMEAVAEVVAVMAVGTNTCNNRSREIDHSAFWTSSRAPRNWCWLPSRDDCMWRMAEAKGAEALMVAEGSSTRRARWRIAPMKTHTASRSRRSELVPNTSA